MTKSEKPWKQAIPRKDLRFLVIHAEMREFYLI